MCRFSGGGLQTLWLSALDERIKAAYISGYFYTIQSALLHTHRCGCNFVPNLWKYVDLGDIAALIAPRPLFIESGKSDKLNGTMGIESAANQVQITKKAYTLFGKENHIQHLIFEGTHVFHGEALSSFYIIVFINQALYILRFYYQYEIKNKSITTLCNSSFTFTN